MLLHFYHDLLIKQFSHSKTKHIFMKNNNKYINICLFFKNHIYSILHSYDHTYYFHLYFTGTQSVIARLDWLITVLMPLHGYVYYASVVS
jgi:hypothetical protein